MTTSSLIVCEQTGRWAAALRRSGIPSPRETRTLEDCGRELTAAPRSFVVLEARANNAESVGRFLAELERAFPEARAAIVMDKSLADTEPGLRELGAACVISSLLRIPDLVAAARQHRRAFDAGSGDILASHSLDLPWPP